MARARNARPGERYKIANVLTLAAKAQEFNEKMVRFYLSKDATEMMDFLAGCHPDAEAIVPPPEEDRSHDSGMEP